MEESKQKFPPLPRIGEPEFYYATKVRRAQRDGDHFARDAFKTGQYITVALDPKLPWDEKLRYFLHAMDNYCHPPPYPAEDVWIFYGTLCNLVRQHAGREAIRIASAMDARLSNMRVMGIPRAKIEDEADRFFIALVPRQQPEWCNESDYQRLKLIRDQWI